MPGCPLEYPVEVSDGVGKLLMLMRELRVLTCGQELERYEREGREQTGRVRSCGRP